MYLRMTLVAMVLGACGGGSDGRPATVFDTDAARFYEQNCAVCHGEIGQGGLAPALLNTERSQAELTAAIDERMPVAAPGLCRGECADDLADFILHGLTDEALACDEVQPSPRRLRLLTRREYRNTVRDLFAGSQGPQVSCQSELQCGLRQSCAASSCLDSPCDGHTFVFDPQGQTPTTVHVAGTFNGWSATIGGGGWPMQYSAETGLWTLYRDLGAGQHQYKFVLDESDWQKDSRNPDGVPDGFGGQNSLLTLSCTGDNGGFDFDPAFEFPVETRPQGFAYDNNADAALVTARHMDAYIKAAAQVVDAVEVADLVSCDLAAGDPACVDSLLIDFGARVFRRPLTTAEIDRYRALVAGGETPLAGAELAVRAMLASPSFLYRSEIGKRRGDGAYRLTGHEVAAALSYTFWGTTPDQALMDAAAAGQLDTAEGIEEHARRLLADPKSRTMVGLFALQWLGAENILTVDKNPGQFPGFDENVRQALADETAEFVNYVVFDSSHAFEELLTADYTFLDDDLAAIYGMPAPGSSAVVRRDYQDDRRAGLISHGSVLGTTAHSDQTSPIRRGVFVRNRLLCQEFPPPPADAATVPSVDPNATTRERFYQHTADPACSGCHRFIDEVGFGFENFGPIGGYRDNENGLPIDSSGDLADVEGLGTGSSAPFSSLPELAQILASSDAAKSCFARQYYRFARGFEERLANRCARLWVEDRFAASAYDIREMMIATVLAPDFALRR